MQRYRSIKVGHVTAVAEDCLIARLSESEMDEMAWLENEGMRRALTKSEQAQLLAFRTRAEANAQDF